MQQKRFYFMFWSKMLSSFPSHCTKISVLPQSPSLREQGRWGTPLLSPFHLFHSAGLESHENTLTCWLWEQRPSNNRNVLFSYKMFCAPVFGDAISGEQNKLMDTSTDGLLSLLGSVLGMDLVRNTPGTEISSDVFQSLGFFSVTLLEGI